MELDTKTRILDAAEQAFAEVGFEAASLRHIIGRAGVNLAAVHYHFGSKEALIEAVFARRIGPLNAERLERLEKLESGSTKLPVEGVIEALVAPALSLSRDAGKGGPVVMRLFGRTIAEPSESLQRLMKAQFGEVVRRFTAALRRAVPHLPEEVIFWRLYFVIGAMGHMMCDPARIKDISGGLCDAQQTDVVLTQLVGFLSHGMKAPVK